MPVSRFVIPPSLRRGSGVDDTAARGFEPRSALRRAGLCGLTVLVALGLARPAQAVTPHPLHVSAYVLNLKFDLPRHELAVDATVTFTPLEPGTTADFELNQNLKVVRVTGAGGVSLNAERLGDRIQVNFPTPLVVQTPVTIVLHYAGQLASAQLSPIEGLRTAYVGPEGAFLLYPGKWFPLAGYDTDRFSATITAALPPPFGLVASGVPSATAGAGNTVVYTYKQSTPSFPGSVLVTPLRATTLHAGPLTTNFYFAADVPAELVRQYGETAGRIYQFLGERFGPAPTNTLHFIELPDDSLPSFASPNMIFLSHGSIGRAVNDRLLTDEIAQEWFGDKVSPATLNDAWLQYGATRFSELLYVEQTAGKTAAAELVRQLAVGALSYPDTALANTASLYPFSPQFQSLTFDKGAMLFHMLRWELGEAPLLHATRDFLAAHAGQAVTTDQFEQALEQETHTDLRPFFSEWYRGNATPDFKNEYVVYRLASGGFRITGKIHQDLDLFRMPVQLRIETDGATEDKRIDVTGTDSSYTVDTAGRPRKIAIDPDNAILKLSPEFQLRVAISRGDNLVAAGDFTGALKEYQRALQVNPISSLAHYRLAEAYFQQENWQSAANEYREALNGDLDPRWIEVWAHLQLGKIFDTTGQRDRAVNEYQLAIQTRDDTDGAQGLARRYLQTPFKK